MADTKISQLPAATTPLSGAEVVPLVQSGATVQTPTNELSKLTAATANTFTVNQVIEVTDNTNAALRVTQLGTGYALRVEDSTNPDSTPFVVDASGNVGIGTTTALGIYGKLRVGGTGYQAINVGSDDGSGVNMIVAANAATEGRVGTVTNHPFDFFTNSTAKARLDTSGNLLITSTGGLGYGTGSGGAVTQITSRTTSVTLNKTNGAVTLFTAAGVTGSWTTFQVLNSTVAATDTVVVSVKTGATNTYIASVPSVSAGNFSITFISLAGTASDAPVINFAVIKAVTA